MVYNLKFALKDSQLRRTVNLRSYNSAIHATVNTYNSICSRTPNKKHIQVIAHTHYLEITLMSHKALNPKYVGIALRLFSQILVQNYGFLPFCTGSNPRKLFVTA